MGNQWPCHCISHKCNGALRSRFRWRSHYKADQALPNHLRQPGQPLPTPSTGTKMQDLNIPLYAGAESHQSLLRTLMITVLLYVSNNGFTLVALDQMIRLQKNSLPSPNNFPSNWQEAEKLLEPFIPKLIEYEACSNDCIVYTRHRDGRDFSTLQSCPKCGNLRKGKGKKTVHYYSLSKRFIRDFGEPNIAKLAHSGALTMTLPDTMKDFQDSKAFHSWYSSGGIFEGYEKSAIPLGLFADGQNPNRNINIDRSMWPLILVNFATQKEFRTTLGPMMLYAIIPGQDGGGEPKLDVYLELAVNDLLSVDNMLVYHSLEKAPLHIKLRFLYYLCDIPAAAKMMNTAGQAGISACTYCWHKGIYNSDLDKCIHLGHRRFLPMNHPMRRSTGFADGFEIRPKPERITPEEEIKMRSDYEKATTWLDLTSPRIRIN